MRATGLSLMRGCLSLAVAGCLPYGNRDSVRDVWPAPFTVSFDSARTLPFVSHTSASDSTRVMLPDVLEVGGRLKAYRGDTLVIRPDYITVCSRLSARESRIVRVTARDVRVDLALIPRDTGVYVSIAPARHGLSSRTRWNILVFVQALIVWNYFRHNPW